MNTDVIVHALTLNNSDPGVPYKSIVFDPESGGMRITEYIDGRISRNGAFIVEGRAYGQGEIVTINEARRIWNYLEGTCGYNRHSWVRNP